MSFHSKQMRALQIVDDIAKSHPSLAETMAALRQHYLAFLEKPAPYLAHAAAQLASAANFQEAAHNMSSALHLHVMHCEKHILDAVNQGPGFLKENEEGLHEKGIVRGADRYFLGTKGNGLDKDSVYDTTWRHMDPSLRPLLGEAVQAACARPQTLERRTMEYVGVRLLDESRKKTFLLNKLSMKSGKQHDHYLAVSADFIFQTAERKGISLPETLGIASARTLPSMPKTIEASMGAPVVQPSLPAAPVPKSFSVPPTVPSALSTAQERSRTPSLAPITKKQPAIGDVLSDPGDIRTLKRQLAILSQRNLITARQENLYAWLHTEGRDGPRTIEDAVQAMKNVTATTAQIMVKDVATKLAKLLEETSEASNAHGHQPRTIRP